MIISEENLNRLKLKACAYMESLSSVRDADFNAGQAYAISLMFHWLNQIDLTQMLDVKENE